MLFCFLNFSQKVTILLYQTNKKLKMEILGIIGIIVLCLFLFVGGGLLGWIFKGLGAILNFLMQGWSSCLGVIVWIFIIFLLFLGLV